MDTHPDRSFTEEEARRLLERAAKLETAQRDLISESELRVIAAEAGIDPTALSAAITESVQLAPAEAANPPHSPGQTKRTLIVAGGIALLTAVFGLEFSERMLLFRPDIVIVGTLILADVGFLARSLASGRHRDFQLANLVLWTGLPATWTILTGDTEAFPICFAFGSAAAAIGALVTSSWSRPDGLVGRVRKFLRSDRAGSVNPPEDTMVPGVSVRG